MKRLNFILCLISCLGIFFFSDAQNSPAPIKLIDFVLTPDQADWEYRVKQPASVQIIVLKNDVPLEDVIISYRLGPEKMPPEEEGNLKLKNGKGIINIGTRKEPGFRQLVVKTEYAGEIYQDQVNLGFSPKKIRPTVKLPEDFNAFWEKAKAEAAKVPMDLKLTHLPELSTPTVDVYLVNLQNYEEGQRLYGYLCKPKAPGKYPVLFHPPGAGVRPTQPFTGFADEGFISLSIEIHGYSPMLDEEAYKDIKEIVGNYELDNLDNHNEYYYKRVFIGCVRSIDYLCSLAEWDGKNVLVTGGSQGGALSIVTAGLDKRVSALASFYPALSDLPGYLHERAGGWPHMFTDSNPTDAGIAERVNTIGYYDVVNFAKQIEVPGFYSWGYNDTTCPPTSVYAAVNSVTAPKTVVITPIAGHWRFEETNQKSLKWLKEQLVE